MKTPFTKTNLFKSGIYLLYGAKRQFVARFKYGGPFTMAVFKKELIKSHSVEDYFKEYESGKAPLEILKNKNPEWYYSTMDAWKNKHNAAWEL